MANETICAEARRNLFNAKKIDRHNRDAHRDNLRFLNAEQWDGSEVRARQGKRLMLTADMLNAPVNQVVNGVRQNKPGPLVDPAGGGADKESALIMEGIMRRVDYENTVWNTFATAMEYGTGGNFGCWEMGLAYKNDRSFDRRITVTGIPDCNETVYFGPAVERDRSDAQWAIRLSLYDLDQYKTDFPDSRLAKRGTMGAIKEVINTWRDETAAGWVTDEGILVAKYWKVIHKRETLRLYTNGVCYWDSEGRPENTAPDPEVAPRTVDRKTVKWYVLNGEEVLKDGDWPGSVIPLFPVYGQERWIGGKRFITSMIQFAKQAQQAFNYAFTGACEVLASTSKVPWIGMVGQFKTALQIWRKANKEVPAFIEFDEVTLKDGQTYVQAPQRNVQEPPIQAFLQFCSLCVNAVQRATSVFDPSLGRQKSEQSGKAIQELQEQSTEGNFHWSDSLTVALCKYYRAMAEVIQAEYDTATVVEIIRPNGEHEEAVINQEYEQQDGVKKFHNIANGMFAFAVSVGPGYDTERKAVASRIKDLVKSLPPQMVAAAADLLIQLFDLGPIGDEIADRLTPPQFRDPADPKSAVIKLTEVMQQNQQLMQLVQKLQQALEMKIPELESRERIALTSALAGIAEARIKVGDAAAERDAGVIELAMEHSHDAGMQAEEHEHAKQINTEQLDAQERMAAQAKAQGAESA